MNIEITAMAKEKLLLMKEKDMPIAIMRYPVGWAGFKYKIVSVKQSENDKLYKVDGFDIIVTGDSQFELKGAKIDYAGLLFKDFIVSPKFSWAESWMYKLWAKKIKNNRIINSVTVSNKDNISNEEKRKKCLDEICKRLDVSIPVWLKKHDMEFTQFKYVTLYAEDFIDEIDFDKLEIELLDNEKNKKWNLLKLSSRFFLYVSTIAKVK